jgi:nucleotide-binding universal stress UspA family protein
LEVKAPSELPIMTYERIVVGTDGSAGSLAATEWTARVAGGCGAEVTIVHAVAPLLEHMFSIPPLESDELVSLVSSELAGPWAEPLRASGVEFEAQLVEDYAAAALISSVRRKKASLLVVGRHGHTRWAPHAMGGVVHKVLHDAACPVVIVPTPEEGVVADDLMDVVVGVDGSVSSLAALDWAIRHAQMLGTSVRAVSAVHIQAGGDVVWLAPTDEEKAIETADDALGRILESKAAETDVELTMRITLGHPGESLVEQSEKAALVVLGSRGLGSVASLLVGSTSHFVATRSHCPTVIVT